MIDPVFLEDIKKPFDTRRFALERAPMDSFIYTPAKPNRPWTSRNHWMIKSKSDSFILLEDLEPDVRRFCQKAIDFMRAFRLPFEDRYLYLTVDDRELEEGAVQRQPGWHFDGMQGSEVETPNPGCFNFLWCDHSPMEYSTQAFPTEDLDRHTVNLFDTLGQQVRPESRMTATAGMTHLMGPYQLHQGRPVERSGRRKLLRLSASHQPITSIRMTINPYMTYDYPYHTTSGAIPSHLVTLPTSTLRSKAA